MRKESKEIKLASGTLLISLSDLPNCFVDSIISTRDSRYLVETRQRDSTPVLLPSQSLEVTQIALELVAFLFDLCIDGKVGEPAFELTCELFGVVEDESVLVFHDELVDAKIEELY